MIRKATAWSVFGHGFDQIVRLMSNLILTRLLAPEMFGVMVVANIFLIAVSLLFDCGLGPSVICRNEETEKKQQNFLNTVWSIQIIRGFIICFTILLFVLTLFQLNENGLISQTSVYSDPALYWVLIAIGFSMAFSGFESTKVITAVKSFAQKELVIFTFISQVTGVAGTIIWALIEPNIWAMVFGVYVTRITRLILSYHLLEGPTNRWHWDWSIVKSILSFGKWILVSTILSVLFVNGDRILMAGIITAEELGVYSIAFLMVYAFQSLISKLNESILLPVLSKTNANTTNEFDVRNTFYKYRFWTDAITLLVTGFLIALAPAVIELLYDDRYNEAGQILQILALTLIAQRHIVIEKYFIVKGVPKISSILNFLRVVFMYLSVPICANSFGFDGALYAIVISNFITIPVTIYYQNKFKCLKILNEILPLIYIAIGWFIGLGLKTITNYALA